MTWFTALTLALAAKAAALSPSNRVYSLQGNHSARGAFHGELELRVDGKGMLDATRVATFDQERYEGLKVQEVWTGHGYVNDDGSADVRFELKQADILLSVDGVSRARDLFGKKLVVDYHVDLRSGAITVSSGDRVESLSGEARSAGVEPLWVNKRRNLVSKGDSHPVIGKLSVDTLFAPTIKKYREDAFTAPYLQRPEFVSQNQYEIFDPTDFEFLRAHPDTIRVVNKVVDSISLQESVLRHDAYAPTLLEKARFFDQAMLDYHLNEYGLLVIAGVNSKGQLEGQSANGDGGLWSGMYAGAQAMRWLVTHEPEAMANFKRALKGLMLLMDITGNEKEFARTAVPMIPGETLTGVWRQGVAPYQHIKYIEGGNNDMIKGILHGFAWAFEILPEGDPVLNEVKAHAPRLLKLGPANSAQHFRNRFHSLGLSALSTKERKYLLPFTIMYNEIVSTADIAQVDRGFYYGGIADWSGINLGNVSRVTEVLIAKNVALKLSLGNSTYDTIFGVAAAKPRILKNARENIAGTWGTYASLRLAYLTIAADAFAFRDDGIKGTAVTKFTHSELFPGAREQAIWMLREIPISRAGHVISYDRTATPEWCPSAWPLRPWKEFSENEPFASHYQGAYQYPIFEGEAFMSDNYWTNHFGFSGGGYTAGQHGRVDYLHAYWMARLSGLVNPQM